MILVENISQFKKALKVGLSIDVIKHNQVLGRKENGTAIFGDIIMPTRKISIVQSNSFAI